MKKHQWLKILCIALIMLCSLACFNIANDKVINVYAEDEIPEEDLEEEEPEVSENLGFAISNTDISDNNLYSALLKIYKNVLSEHEISYSGSTLYSKMFDNEWFTEINVDYKNISSLEGLDFLEMPYLTSFSASRNQISAISERTFRNAENLTTINFASNKISSINLSNLSRLTDINLNSNSLQKLNLSHVEGKEKDTEITISLANNKFTSMEDIKLPERKIGKINLNILSNNIANIDEKYFTEKYNLNIGIQGFTNTTKIANIETMVGFNLYKTNIANCAIEIYKLTEDDEDLVATYSDEDIDGDYLNVKLGIGSYYYVYTLDGESAYQKNNCDRDYYISSKFDVVPTKATYLFVYKDKEYTTLNKVTGVVNVKLFAEEGATIYYSYKSDGKWIEGNEVCCDKGGSYNIKVKVVKDGVESEVKEIYVSTSLNRYIPDGFMLVIVLFIMLVVIFIIIPLISRKFFKKD